MLLGARTTARASARGTAATRRRSRSASSTAMPMQTPTHALRVNVRPRATSTAGSTSSGQTRSRAAEQQARRRDARHDHQRARVRHVVGERALRTSTEVVEVQEAVLEQADEGAGRADGDDHRREEVRPMPAREPVHQRHDQEQHQLLGVDQADGGVHRGGRGDQGDGGVRGEGPEETRAPRAAPRASRGARPSRGASGRAGRPRLPPTAAARRQSTGGPRARASRGDPCVQFAVPARSRRARHPSQSAPVRRCRERRGPARQPRRPRRR